MCRAVLPRGEVHEEVRRLHNGVSGADCAAHGVMLLPYAVCLWVWIVCATGQKVYSLRVISIYQT